MCAAISALSGKPDTITITHNLVRGEARGAEGLGHHAHLLLHLVAAAGQKSCDTARGRLGVAVSRLETIMVGFLVKVRMRRSTTNCRKDTMCLYHSVLKGSCPSYCSRLRYKNSASPPAIAFQHTVMCFAVQSTVHIEQWKMNRSTVRDLLMVRFT